MSHGRRLGAAIVLLAALASSARLSAQEGGKAAALVGSLTGSVIDAESAERLGGVQVIAEPIGPGSDGAGPCAGRSASERAITRTDVQGRYAFPALAAGTYLLELRHVGYRPARLRVDLCPSTAFQLSVSLQIQAVVLEPLRVSVAAHKRVAEKWKWGWGDDGGRSARTRVEERRQADFLESDARVVTGSDVESAVSLAQSDLFRALQRLPGVAIRDDYSAELWTRGAPWGQTSVVFDGVPLLNPLHAAGLFSAVNGDAVERVLFHPGVQPLSAVTGGAGLISIHSRRGAGGGQVSGVGDISPVSAGLALDQEVAGGRGAWMVAGRRTYLDLLSGAVPYHFSDLVARTDYEFLPGLHVEASAIHEEDRLEGEIRNIVRPALGSRGNTAARITVEHPLAGGALRHTLGTSRFGVAVEPLGPPPMHDPEAGVFPAEARPYRLQPTRSGAAYSFLEGAWRRAQKEGATGWKLGYRLVSQAVHYRTEGGWPYRSRVAVRDQRLTHGMAWGEATWRPSSVLTVEAGLHTGLNGGGAAALALAPRLSARLRLARGLTASAGLARTHQHLQPVQPEGPGLTPVAMAGTFWALAGGDVPLLRADIATAGAEYWLGPEVLLSATAFRRSTAGMVVADPRRGESAQREDWVEGKGRASGLDLSARRLAGRWTGSVGYSLGDSRVATRHGPADAPWGRTHTLDVTAGAQLPYGFRAGAAYTATSGAPYTRSWTVYSRCDSSCGDWRLTPWVGPAGEARTPTYRSLAVQVNWERAYSGWALGAYLQVHNLLDRPNAAAYTGNEALQKAVCVRGLQSSCDSFWLSDRVPSDTWLPGLRRIPTFGIRLRF